MHYNQTAPTQSRCPLSVKNQSSALYDGVTMLSTAMGSGNRTVDLASADNLVRLRHLLCGCVPCGVVSGLCTVAAQGSGRCTGALGKADG